MRKLHMPHIQITSAALHIYAAEGARGLTMRRVAGAVGVTAAALYRHFRNKDALVDAIAHAAEGRLGERLQRPRRPRRSARGVDGIAERALEFAVAQPHLFQLVARRKPRDLPESRAGLRDEWLGASLRLLHGLAAR